MLEQLVLALLVLTTSVEKHVSYQPKSLMRVVTTSAALDLWVERKSRGSGFYLLPLLSCSFESYHFKGNALSGLHLLWVKLLLIQNDHFLLLFSHIKRCFCEAVTRNSVCHES